jgi:outer membrane protein assembly factor BamE (lipoprotein component of BamABCDE complex)
MNRTKKNIRISALAAKCMTGAVLLTVAMSACSPRLESHGNMPDQEIVESIRIGKSNRAQILEMLGTPSVRATFDQEAWYYVGARTSRFAFMKAEVLERRVLVIRFDDKGIVQQVERLDKEDGRDVQVVDRKTPTKGRELTILEQLLGNVGRFGGAPADNGRAGL